MISDPANGKIDLHLHNGSTHQFQPNDPNQYNMESFDQSDLPLQFGDAAEESKTAVKNPEREQSLHELLTATGPRTRDAQVELQRRFAFPVACIVFALLAVPLRPNEIPSSPSAEAICTATCRISVRVSLPFVERPLIGPGLPFVSLLFVLTVETP